MHVGYLNYNGSVELGVHNLGANGNSDLRTNLLVELLKYGHRITFYTKLAKETKDWISNTTEGKIFKDVIIDVQSGTVDPSVDFLFVENGASNAKFGFRFNDEEIPFVAYSNKIISSYKGLVFYSQIDPALPFCFYPEFFSLQYLNNNLKHGNFKTLLADKKFVVLAPATSLPNFITANSGIRYNYSNLTNAGLIDVDYFEMHYCCLYGWDNFKPIKEHRNVISYVGGERPRIAKFKKFLVDLKREIPVEVWGRWTDKTKDKFKADVDFKGLLEKGKSREVYNNSFATVVMGDVVYEKIGLIAGRFFEAITGSALPLVDIDLLDSNVSNLLDLHLLKEIIVVDSKDVLDKYKKLAFSQERVDLINELAKQLKRFKVKDSYDQLMALYTKYKDAPRTDMQVLNSTFAMVLNNRAKQPVFQEQNYTDVVRIYYALNADEENNLNSELKNVKYDYDTRCFQCGEPLKPTEITKTRHQYCESCKVNKAVDLNLLLRNRAKNIEYLIKENQL